MTIAVEPRPIKAIKADIARYESWLDVPPVQAGTKFDTWVRSRRDAAKTELAAAQKRSAA